MIVAADFLSRRFFEDRVPGARDAVISIGDPDQATPACLSGYDRWMRSRFLDLDPETCRLHRIPVEKCFSGSQASTMAKFILDTHSLPDPFSVIVHCEAGVSRSAGVVLAIARHARCPLPDRDISCANTHVTRMLSCALINLHGQNAFP